MLEMRFTEFRGQVPSRLHDDQFEQTEFDDARTPVKRNKNKPVMLMDSEGKIVQTRSSASGRRPRTGASTERQPEESQTHHSAQWNQQAAPGYSPGNLQSSGERAPDYSRTPEQSSARHCPDMTSHPKLYAKSTRRSRGCAPNSLTCTWCKTHLHPPLAPIRRTTPQPGSSESVRQSARRRVRRKKRGHP